MASVALHKSSCTHFVKERPYESQWMISSRASSLTCSRRCQIRATVVRIVTKFVETSGPKDERVPQSGMHCSTSPTHPRFRCNTVTWIISNFLRVSLFHACRSLLSLSANRKWFFHGSFSSHGRYWAHFISECLSLIIQIPRGCSQICSGCRAVIVAERHHTPPIPWSHTVTWLTLWYPEVGQWISPPTN